AAEPVTSASTSIRVADHLGSLYSPFVWSGPVRDPYRDSIEITDPALYQPLTADEKSALTTTLQQRDIIMQIGGMGSAKLWEGGAQVHPNFKTYMDALVADSGAAWRYAAAARAREVIEATPDGSRVYWQIGNEINASSYLQNINLYFGASYASTFDIIPVYVEYFLAPTLQAFQQAASDSGKPVRVALGSIAGFANINSQQFLNNLLNYEITGTYAPNLAGRKVYELVDIVTIHYLMNASTAENPEIWRDALVSVRDQWLGVGNISGVWSTEDVGIRAAEDGMGAGSALRILSRYLGWVSENQFDRYTARWFFFGTTAGPVGQAINDSLTQWQQLTGDVPLEFVAKQHSSDGTRETYLFKVSGRSQWLMTITAVGNNTVSVTDADLDIAVANVGTASVQAWRYGMSGTQTLAPALLAVSSGGRVHFNAPVSLDEPDAVLVWVSE